MSKGDLYATARRPVRISRPDAHRAIELFQSTGRFEGDPSLTALVVTHCFEHYIPFKWTLAHEGAIDNSIVERIKS